MRKNQFSTPVILEEENNEEVPEEENGECSQTNEFSFLRFHKINRLNVLIGMHINIGDRPYTRSRGACLDLPLSHPYLLERKRRNFFFFLYKNSKKNFY